MRAVLASLIVLLMGAPAPMARAEVAVDVAALQDRALDERARILARQVRCLVCQNQSIEDSNADLARDLRQLIRERIKAGDDDAQVLQYLVARYGDWVLLKPPFDARHLALWLAPLGVVAALGAALVWRRRRSAAPGAPLSADEQAQLNALLSDPPR